MDRDSGSLFPGAHTDPSEEQVFALSPHLQVAFRSTACRRYKTLLKTASSTQKADDPSSSRESSCATSDNPIWTNTPPFDDSWLSNTDTQIPGSLGGTSFFDMPHLEHPHVAVASTLPLQHVDDGAFQATPDLSDQVQGMTSRIIPYDSLFHAHQPYETGPACTSSQHPEDGSFHGTVHFDHQATSRESNYIL